MFKIIGKRFTMFSEKIQKTGSFMNENGKLLGFSRKIAEKIPEKVTPQDGLPCTFALAFLKIRNVKDSPKIWHIMIRTEN